MDDDNNITPIATPPKKPLAPLFSPLPIPTPLNNDTTINIPTTTINTTNTPSTPTTPTIHILQPRKLTPKRTLDTFLKTAITTPLPSSPVTNNNTTQPPNSFPDQDQNKMNSTTTNNPIVEENAHQTSQPDPQPMVIVLE